MRKIIFVLLLISTLSYAQNIPQDFELGTHRLNKTISPNPASNAVDDIVIAGDTIIIATARGVSYSFNNGDTWNNFDDEEVFADDQISRIAYRDGVIWAGLWHIEEWPDGPAATGGGLVYTRDFGNTWIHIDQPVDDSLDNTIQYGNNIIRALPVTIPQQNMVYDIELTSNTVWIASWSAGIRKSTDMGETWQRVVLPPDDLNEIHPEGTYNFDLSPVPKWNYRESLNHIGRSILVIDDNTIYCGTAGGINKTTDGGLSWRKFNHTNQANPISGNHVWAMKYDPYDNSIWAATWKANGESEFWGISKSTDGGENWDVFLPQTKAMDFSFRYFFEDGNIERRDIITVTEDEGVFRSTDEGVSWIKAPTIFDNDLRLELNTDSMNAVETRNDGNSSTIFIGNQRGLVRMIETNYAWDGEWKIFFVSGEVVSASNSSFAFPNPFSPLQNEVSIKYSTQSASDVTIRIFDFGMNLVKTIIQNAPRNASEQIIERWDGRDENGNYIANGVYFYRIDVNSNDPLYGKILVVK